MSATDLPVVVLPDPVQLVTAWLRVQPELAGVRLHSIIPAERTYPLVLVAQVADTPLIQRPWWATAADLQVSAYAAQSNQARALLETVRGVTTARLIGAQTGGTVAWVAWANASFQPDGSIQNSAGRPMPRWVSTLTVTVHPTP
jgi:hypothetical protein